MSKNVKYPVIKTSYPLVEIHWLDHHFTPEDDDDERLCIRSTVGYLVKETDDFMKISSTVEENGKSEVEFNTIGKAMIEKVYNIRRGKIRK